MIMNQKKAETGRFLNLVEQRKSIRRFMDTPVEREKILSCIQAARLAPSAENSQPWRFLIFDDPVIRQEFAENVFSGIYSVSKFAAKAPVMIIILAQLHVVAHKLGKQVQGVPFHLLDIGISGEHLVLQAEELGLGTCWVGWFNMKKARKYLQLPKKYKIIALLPLGYYEKKPSRERKRKSLEEIAWFNRIQD